MALKEVFVLFTMDCEPAKTDVSAHALRMSRSGPKDYEESERSIRGYVEAVRAFGFSSTLFVHPEVAVKQRDLLLELQSRGVCLGLHLHPYKFGDGRYRRDLGAYSASEQYKLIKKAMTVWENALGQKPLYFRPGYFSANDNTFRVLQKLGFRGGSVSCPGRELLEHYSLWSGAEPYPHRANLNFRQLKGSSKFVEVPISVDFQRPVLKGHAGQKGYEWLYVPCTLYDHKEVLRNILKRFKVEAPRFPVIVTDTHNDQDYSNHENPARSNLSLILNSIKRFCREMDVKPKSCTLDDLCDLVLSERLPKDRS